MILTLTNGKLYQCNNNQNVNDLARGMANLNLGNPIQRGNSEGYQGGSGANNDTARDRNPRSKYCGAGEYQLGVSATYLRYKYICLVFLSLDLPPYHTDQCLLQSHHFHYSTTNFECWKCQGYGHPPRTSTNTLLPQNQQSELRAESS